MAIRNFAVALSVVALTACVTAPKTYTFDEPRTSVKVLQMPIDAEVYFVKLGASDLRADWTETVTQNFQKSLQDYLKSTGETVVEFETFSGEIDDLDQLLLLEQQVTTAMGQHVIPLMPGQPIVPLPHRAGEVDMSYTLGSDAEQLRAATGADYAAFLTNRTSVESGGSVMTKLLIGGVTGYTPGLSTFRGTYVSLVDLKTGDVVWIKAQAGSVFSGSDARDPEGADRVVKAIMDDGPFMDTDGDES